jgi:autotransporter-associated beta strand protein
LNLRGGGGTTQTFSGNLTGLTGIIGVNSGSTLKLSGTGDSSSGVLGSVSLATRGGTIVLDNTAGNTSNTAGRISDSAAISFTGGGISLIGNSAGTSETVGAPAFVQGYNTISVTNNGGTGAQLTFTRTAGSWRDVSTGMVINFVGAGTGTLGSSGNNPRITSTGAPITITSGSSAPLGMFANTATGATVGWATVNGTEWAGYGANGVVALTPNATPTTAANLASLLATSMAVFSPTATVTASGNVTVGALKITPNGGTTLAMGSNALTTTALMLAGTTDFAITGTSNLAGGAHKYVYVSDANTTLTMSQNMGGSNQGFTKAGLGFLSLNGTTLSFTNAQNINLASGVLRGTAAALGGATSAGGAFSSINFRGGVLELSGGFSFVRAIDLAGTTSGGGVSFDGGSDRGDGGFSAIGGNATVTLVTAIGGSTAASLVWNDNAFLSNGYVLTMGSTKADSRVDFTNDIGLDSGSASTNYFAREVRVADNTGSTTDVARLSGVISGSANADLLKTGAGVLELTNTNTYAGNTLIQQGTLIATNGAAIANTSAVSLANTAGATFQLSNNETIGALSGGGTTGGNVTLQANTLTVGDQRDSTFGGVISSSGSPTSSLVKQGTGTLTLSGANTYSGNTTISGGTLALGSAGTLASSPVITVGSTGSTGTVLDLTAKSAFSFAGTQTVKGIGTINIGANKTVTIAGTLAPGNSIGTNNVTGDLALTGTLQSELGTSGATASAGVSDRTDVSGNLTLTGSTLQLVNNSGANSQGSAGAGAYRLATYGGSLTGTFSTITNPLSATLHEVASYGSGNVDLALYRLATATAPTSSVNLGNVRVGGTLTGNASITNSASRDGFSEQLKATVSGSGTGFTAVAGGSSGTVNYSLTTSAAGVQSGNASVVLKSTGAGTYADTTLSTTAVSLSGAAYNPASAAASQTVNIKTRVDVAGTASVSLANTGAASATYQETLGTTGFSGITDGFTATGSATGIAGGASGSGTLSVGGTFSSSGTYSGSATLGLQTQAVNSSGLGNLAITGQTVNINVTAYDLASPSFTKTSGVGSFGGLSLDFGTVSIGTTYTATFDLANASGAFRDYLGGTFTYTGAGSISSTAADVTSLAAGSSTAFTVTFNPTTSGTYTGTIRFTGLSKQTNLADVQLAAQDIAITGTAIPEPSAYAALVGVGVIGAALHRRRRLKAV